MFDDISKLILGALGLFAIVMAVVTMLVTVIRLVRSGRGLVIAPFHVTGIADPTSQLGGALALMLQARIRQLQRELDIAQRSLIVGDALTDTTLADTARPLRPLELVKPVKIPTEVFEASAIEVTVAGVDFGGLVAWVHRSLLRRRTAVFAVHCDNGRAVVSGNLPASALPDGALWFECGDAPEEIVSKIAYVLLQKTLSAGVIGVITALDVEEFSALTGSIFEVAELNRRLASGRLVERDEFEKVLLSLEPLITKVPRWPELLYFFANLAESLGGRNVRSNITRMYMSLHPNYLAPDQLLRVLEGRLPQRWPPFLNAFTQLSPSSSTTFGGTAARRTCLSPTPP